MDRRKTIDFWAKLLFYFNITAWIVLLAIMLLFHRAQPEFETLFDRFWQLNLRTHWDIEFLYYLTYMVIFGIVFSIFGLILSMFRGRRENDHKKVLILTGVISLVLLLVSVNIL